MIFETDSSARVAMAVFAHPDDAELTCFGTLCNLNALGYSIYGVYLTGGENSSKASGADRRNATLQSMKLLDGKTIFGPFEDGDVTYHSRCISYVQALIEEYRPSVLITHYSSDGSECHQDHHYTRLCVSNVARRMDFIRYFLLAEPEYNIASYSPNLYVDVRDHFDRKLEAIAYHSPENQKYFLRPEYVTTRALWWGMQSNKANVFEGKRYESFVAKFIQID